MAGVDLGGGGRGTGKSKTKLSGTRQAPGKPTNQLKVGSTVSAKTGAKAPVTRSAAPSRKGAGAGYTSPTRAMAQAADMRARQQLQQQPPEEESPDFLDLLNRALQMVQGMQGGDSSGIGAPDFSAARADLQNRASEGDSRIADMYRQLQASYAADAPGIQQGYNQAAGTVQQGAEQASASVDQGYQASRDEQTRQMQALGIEPAAANLASYGGEAARDQALAKSNIEQNRVANAGQIQQNAQAAGTYNTEIGQAAGLEGNMQRSQLQRSLQSKLAELSLAEQDAQRQYAASQQSQQSNGLSQALQLLNAQMGFENDQQADQKDEFSQQFALQQYLDQQQQAKMQAAQRGSRPQDILEAIQGMGVNPGDQNYARILSALAQVYK